MGMFVNPDNSAFQVALNSEIYVDKTGLIGYTNRVMNTLQGYVCVSARGGLENPWLRICLRHITAEAVIPEKYFPNLKYPRVLILKSTEISIIPFFLNMQEFLSRSDSVEALVDRVKKTCFAGSEARISGCGLF